MTALSLALSLVLAAPAPQPIAPRDEAVRERAWKVTLSGGVTVLAGVGFLVAGTVILAANPEGSRLNTGHAFQTGGVMLTCAGVVLAALSIPMWMWRTDAAAASPVVTLAVGPGSLRVTW